MCEEISAALHGLMLLCWGVFVSALGMFGVWECDISILELVFMGKPFEILQQCIEEPLGFQSPCLYDRHMSCFTYHRFYLEF